MNNSGPDNDGDETIGDEKKPGNLRHKQLNNNLHAICQKQTEYLNEQQIKNETTSAELAKIIKSPPEIFGETVLKVEEHPEAELSMRLVSN